MYQQRRRCSKFKSIYRGVTPLDGGRWRVQIAVDGLTRHVAVCHNEREAALAYDKAARELYGDKALTNFPVEGQ